MRRAGRRSDLGYNPMVAPNYAERRSQFAKESGLGRRRPAEPEPELTPVKKGRRKAAPSPAA